jgi:hypothetical protein
VKQGWLYVSKRACLPDWFVEAYQCMTSTWQDYSRMQESLVPHTCKSCVVLNHRRTTCPPDYPNCSHSTDTRCHCASTQYKAVPFMSHLCSRPPLLPAIAAPNKCKLRFLNHRHAAFTSDYPNCSHSTHTRCQCACFTKQHTPYKDTSVAPVQCRSRTGQGAG